MIPTLTGRPGSGVTGCSTHRPQRPDRVQENVEPLFAIIMVTHAAYRAVDLSEVWDRGARRICV